MLNLPAFLLRKPARNHFFPGRIAGEGNIITKAGKTRLATTKMMTFFSQNRNLRYILTDGRDDQN
jgi:hypothetical protein